MNIKYFKYNALHDSLNQIKGTCISQSSGFVTEVKYKIKYTGNRWNFSDINKYSFGTDVCLLVILWLFLPSPKRTQTI